MSYNPLPTTETIPHGDDPAVTVRTSPQHISRIGFTKAIVDGIDTTWGQIVGSTGTDMTVKQTGGNLVVTSGTTARSETIIRGLESFDGGVRIRARSTLSQRIVNNNFFVELVDVIGDGLAYTIGSATAITVTMPAGMFTAESVGQSMHLGMFVGTGTFVSGRYPIASVAGDDVTFTVSAFAVGTGTLSAFGWNYYQLQYNGTTATTANFDTQRNGYASGVTAATINTTAAPGHLAVITGNDLVCTFADQLVASGATIKQTVRATRDENVPDDTPLRLQLRIANGTTAPASTTTWTVGLVSVTNYANQSVSINDVRPMGVTNGMPVEVLRAATQTVTGTVTVTSTAVAALATVVGQTPFRDVALTNTDVSVKTSAGRVYSYYFKNADASATAWVHFYNALIANVTVGTTVPVWSVEVPAMGKADISLTVPLSFATAITIAATTSPLHTVSTAPTTALQAYIGYI